MVFVIGCTYISSFPVASFATPSVVEKLAAALWLLHIKPWKANFSAPQGNEVGPMFEILGRYSDLAKVRCSVSRLQWC